MKIFGTQFGKISGPDATNSYNITFTLDESQRKSLRDLIELKKGTELLMLLFETNKDNDEIQEITDETEEQLKTRFNKRMHALINTIASEKNIKTIEIKKILKDFLIKKKYIKESTSELSIKGFAAAIYYLQNEFN